MNILLVDDEAIIRAGMRALIPWEEHGYRLVGEAADASQGMAMAMEHRPDIMLVDIGLPDRNGLSLIEDIQRVLPACRHIILSCQDAVGGFTQAIQLGVRAYLLKSTVSPEELLSVLDRVRMEIRRERVFENPTEPGSEHINRTVVLTEFLNGVLQGLIRDESAIRRKLDSHFNGSDAKSYRFVTLRVDTSTPQAETHGETALRSLLQLCQQILQDTGEGLAFFQPDGTPTLLLVNRTNPEASQTGVDTGRSAGTLPAWPEGDRSTEICRRTRETALQMLDIPLFFGLGCPAGPEALQTGHRESALAAERFFFPSAGYQHTYRQDPPVQQAQERLHTLRLDLLKRMQTNTAEETRVSLEQLAAHIRSAPFQDPSEVRSCYRQLLLHAHLIACQHIDSSNGSGDAVETLRSEELSRGPFLPTTEELERSVSRINTFEALHMACKHQIMTCLHTHVDAGMPDAEDLVRRMKRHIGRTLHEKVRLADVAAHVHLSPDYAGRVFRRITGMTIIAYLLECRIAHAKAMLRHGQSLREITDSLCFSSESHLIRTFHRITGMTPKKFLQQDGIVPNRNGIVP